ncbi:MAG: DNA polymerase IV [Bacillota bacterium]|jgi:DNA polymerase-4
MERLIMHVDMDAYFAAVEQTEVPSLRGKPVVVCGFPLSRSVVTTASYEARKFGIKAGMPASEARRMAPAALFIESNPQKYIAISLKIVSILCEFSPKVEPYSIDESFIDLTGCLAAEEHGVAGLAAKIKERIRAETRLSCSIGAGPNKLLAKIATEMHKPDGFMFIRPEDIASKVWPLGVEKLHGIGRKTAANLKQAGIQTIGDLARIPPHVLKRMFGANGYLIWQSANGIDHSPVDPAAVLSSKSCGHELTFPEDTADQELVLRYALFLCDAVARRMRQAGYRGRTVTLKLRSADFKTFTRSRTRSSFTDSAEEIFSDIAAMLSANWPGEPIRLIGVSVSGFLSVRRLEKQLGLFPGNMKHDKLVQTVDMLKDKYGDNVVRRASFLQVPSKNG